MSLFLTALVYVIMGLILGVGILMVVKGSFWLLAVGGLAYLLLFLKYGCTAH
jgi:hypothetical protein